MDRIFDKLKTVWRPEDHAGVKSFKENQLKEDAFATKNRGTQTVPLEHIVGSVGRYHDFDKKFRLKHHVLPDKFERVRSLMQAGVSLPPVKLYQIKDEYYVLDGNHRVSAAKALGHHHIAARIIEFLPSPTKTRPPLHLVGQT